MAFQHTSGTAPDTPPASRREAILAAAEGVFAENGYASTTVEAVARRAGVSKGSIYNYFQGKHDIFAQIFDVAMRRDLAEAEKTAADAASATEGIEGILEAWAERLEKFRIIGRLVLEFWAAAAREGREGDFGEVCDRHCTEAQALFAGIVRQGIASGEFAEHMNPDVAASLILALLRGLAVHTMLSASNPVTPELLEALKRSILASLKAPLEGPAS